MSGNAHHDNSTVVTASRATGMGALLGTPAAGGQWPGDIY
jgi:hypothetical protein